jgi:hypothetical protein
MLTVSEEDYRELQRISRLRKGRQITKAELRKLAAEILEPARQEEALRQQKEEVRNEKQKQRREFRRKLRAADSLYRRPGGPFVQGGLPSLGKRT